MCRELFPTTNADCRRRRAYDPLHNKGPPTLNERAADYALPLKRQENCGLKGDEKPRAATARQYIIYHAYFYKHHIQPAYCINNVKTSYMLDFNEVFWNVDKREKTRGKRRKNTWKTWKISRKIADSEIFLRTRCVVGGSHVDAVRCGRRFQNTDALRCWRRLFAHL